MNANDIMFPTISKHSHTPLLVVELSFPFSFGLFFFSKCMITHWSDDKLDVTQIEIGLLRTQGTLNHRQSSLWITDCDSVGFYSNGWLLTGNLQSWFCIRTFQMSWTLRVFPGKKIWVSLNSRDLLVTTCYYSISLQMVFVRVG